VPIERLRLDPVDLGLDPRDLLGYLGCQRGAGRLGCSSTPHSDEKADYRAYC